MDEHEEFKNQLNEIRENTLLEVSRWWGLFDAGYAGTIVKNNKEVYVYQYYHHMPKNFNQEEKKYIKKIRDLSDEEFERIRTFVKNEIMDKEYEDRMIHDAGYKIFACYDGACKVVNNNKGYGDEPEIYDITRNLLREILYQKK